MQVSSGASPGAPRIPSPRDPLCHSLGLADAVTLPSEVPRLSFLGTQRGWGNKSLLPNRQTTSEATRSIASHPNSGVGAEDIRPSMVRP